MNWDTALDWNNLESWTVVLVDDEPDNVEVLSETLEFNGITVKFAANGQLGLALLQDTCPTLILLDLSMPVMDGWQALRHIRANAALASVPVIAISAHAIHGDKERALAVGFDGYLTKPINVPTLIADIRRALAETAQAQDLKKESVL